MKRRAGAREPLLDGRVFCEQALGDLARRVRSGEKVRVVFDIDDTLSESRARTMAVARGFDAANGTRFFSKLSLEQVGSSGGETAKALGLPDDVVAKFQAHWEVEFWKGSAFVHDTPIAPMVELAKRARAAGAEVVYLTGRVEALESATIAQLRRFGLEGVDAKTVVSKPELTVRTAPFKTEWLQRSAEAGHHLAFFITESRRDIAAVQRDLVGAPAVLVDSPFSGPEPVASTTPVYRLGR